MLKLKAKGLINNCLVKDKLASIFEGFLPKWVSANETDLVSVEDEAQANFGKKHQKGKVSFLALTRKWCLKR